MKVLFNKTCIGYSHIDNNTRCQDSSFSYQDEERIIFGACDGHGGNVYVRSDLGAKFASKAIVDVLKDIELNVKVTEAKIKAIKLKIISRWNQLVEQDYALSPFKFYELEGLNEREKEKLNNNYVIAYGTTLNAVLICKNHLLCLSIGDGGVFLIKDEDNIIAAIEDDEDENVANITYSLCGEDVYNHFHIKHYKRNEYQGALTVTDGVVNPYQSYNNFFESFAKPIIKEIKDDNKKGVKNVKEFIKNLGVRSGIGDDVSLAFYMELEEEKDNEVSNENS